MDNLIHIMAKAKEAWLNKNQEEHIVREVCGILDKQKLKAIRYFLGFKENQWNNKWEFDGKQESLLRDHINQSVEAAAKEFIKSLEGRSFRPTKAMEESFLKHYEKTFKNAVEEMAEVQAQKDAKEFYQKLINKMEADDPTAAYQKLRNLIEGN